MAENNDPIFGMDVGDVLARLHISSVLKLQKQPYFVNGIITSIFNTGIVDMVENPKLDDVKNNGISFDMTAPNGRYFIGVVIGHLKSTSKQQFVEEFTKMKKHARQAMFDYFAAFAGEYKSRNIEESELYGFLIKPGLKPWHIDEYKQYKYTIPAVGDVDFNDVDKTIEFNNSLCFRIEYKLDSDTM